MPQATGATPISRAADQAAEMMKTLPAGTALHLAYFDAEGVEQEPEARIEPGLAAGSAGSDIGKALAWARDIVVGSRRTSRQVVLWTDLQRVGLRSPLETPFPPDVRIDLIDVGRPVAQNLAVELSQAEQTDLRHGKPVRVTARVFNAGLFPARDVPVRLVLEGQSAIEQNVTVAGRSRGLVHFDVPLEKPALYSGFVEVKAGDLLPFDDRRYLAFETRMPERVLLVDGEPGPSIFGNETYYLETALRLSVPGEQAKEASPTPYEPTRIAAAGGSFLLPDLARYRIVFMCNVANVTREQAAALSRFVESGGSLIIFVGDRVSAGAYEALEEQNVLPGRNGEPVETGPYRPAQWSNDHPIVSPFADPLHGDLRSLRFSKIARITPTPEARVVVSAVGGMPILVERNKGAGHCLLFGIPADNAWGDWAIHSLFLPLVHQVAGYASGRLAGAGRVREAASGSKTGEVPGVTIENGRALVRNVDPAESDVERMTLAGVREFYGLSARARATRMSQSARSTWPPAANGPMSSGARLRGSC